MKTGILLFAALFAAVISANAQFTLGNLRGHVTDPSGAAVSGAKLELKDLSTQAVQTAQTDGAGDYAFSSLQPRGYQLTVSASGFTQVSAAITLGISQQLVQ